MWADSGYDGTPLARYARAAAAITSGPSGG
jgi:hypothetical protein